MRLSEERLQQIREHVDAGENDRTVAARDRAALLAEVAALREELASAEREDRFEQTLARVAVNAELEWYKAWADGWAAEAWRWCRVARAIAEYRYATCIATNCSGVAVLKVNPDCRFNEGVYLCESHFTPNCDAEKCADGRLRRLAPGCGVNKCALRLPWAAVVEEKL